MMRRYPYTYNGYTNFEIRPDANLFSTSTITINVLN